MKIIKRIMELLALVCLVLVVITRKKSVALALLIVALVRCGVLIYEQVMKKGK